MPRLTLIPLLSFLFASIFPPIHLGSAATRFICCASVYGVSLAFGFSPPANIPRKPRRNMPLPATPATGESPEDDGSFVIAQYNVLAGTLGSNTHPWFLHGLPNLSPDRRSAITARFYRRDERTGQLLKRGWPDHVEGILTPEERRIVEDVDRRHFAWEGRKARLLETVKRLDADLISIVECDHYDEYWKEEMSRLGYGGIYVQRPRVGCSDGCAIFYRRNVFDLLEHRGVDLIDRKKNEEGSGGGSNNDDDDRRPISRMAESVDRVALLALLLHKPTARRLIFVSTHLARNPEDPSKTKERARQVAQIMYHVTLFAQEHEVVGQQNAEKRGAEAEAPVVLAGDLNETNLSHLGIMARIKCGVAEMRCHPFLFTSRVASPAAVAMPTSITSCRSMRIDYILLQPSLLEVCESSSNGRDEEPLEVGVEEELFDAEAAEEEECGVLVMELEADPIPNETHPSDHLPVAFRVRFRDRHNVAEGCAASWVEAVAKGHSDDDHHQQQQQQKEQGRSNTDCAPRPGSVLQLEELEEAFDYFDANEDGLCDRAELSSGFERLRIDDPVAEKVLNQATSISSSLHHVDELSSSSPALTLDVFRALYVKSWLRRQRSFLDRVRSLRTIFHLSVESTNFSSREDLFAEMDADGDGIVTVEDAIDHLARVERSEDSLHNRVADAFSFFDFDSGDDFSMQELHQCFAVACPFEVSTDLLQVAFAEMGKDSEERVELDEFIDWLVRRLFRRDIGWISLIGPIPK